MRASCKVNRVLSLDRELARYDAGSPYDHAATVIEPSRNQVEAARSRLGLSTAIALGTLPSFTLGYLGLQSGLTNSLRAILISKHVPLPNVQTCCNNGRVWPP